jgi:cytosine/uracil/thiamine/allantoin permease
MEFSRLSHTPNPLQSGKPPKKAVAVGGAAIVAFAAVVAAATTATTEGERISRAADRVSWLSSRQPRSAVVAVVAVVTTATTAAATLVMTQEDLLRVEKSIGKVKFSEGLTCPSACVSGQDAEDSLRYPE